MAESYDGSPPALSRRAVSVSPVSLGRPRIPKSMHACHVVCGCVCVCGAGIDTRRCTSLPRFFIHASTHLHIRIIHICTLHLAFTLPV